MRDGAVFVRLEQVTDPALVAAEIASALAHRDQADGPGADALPSYLRDRELLLVIDNFEHLLAAAILPAELLAVAPRLRVLVSSRTPLRIRGEQVFDVAAARAARWRVRRGARGEPGGAAVPPVRARRRTGTSRSTRR